MRNKIIFTLAIIFLITSACHAQEKNDVSGNWNGALKVGAIQLRIVFKISENEEGKLSAKMDSPDQGAKDIPCGELTLSGNKLKIDLPAINGFYEGTLNSESNKLDGTWNQAGQVFPLILEKTNVEIILNRPQEPKGPLPYNSEDITFENSQAGITLAGTLTYPKSNNPSTAVILITGSGAQNRNEELLGHKPFLVLADFLTRQGIVVLRFDDRGVGKSTGDFTSATSEDFATDVSAGIEYLKTRNEVIKTDIGLIGHSEGGLIAPMVAVKSDDVAFIVLMAGPGLPGDQILSMQSILISKVSGKSDEDIRKSDEVNKKIYMLLKDEPDSVKAHQEATNILKNYYSKLSSAEKEEAGDENTFLQMLYIIESPWFKFFLKYDPRPTLEKVSCPVLAVNGEKDLQVPPKENLGAIKEALTKGGNKNFKTIILPGLNHLFQSSTTGSPSEYNTIEETISPIALKTMGDWIMQIKKK